MGVETRTAPDGPGAVANSDAGALTSALNDTTLSVNAQGVPPELKARPQWVVWRIEKPPGRDKLTKVPYNAGTGHKGRSDTPSTWATFEAALSTYENGRGYNGVGYVLSAEDGYTGLDLDHCLNSDGIPEQWAATIVRKLDSYTERSPGGEGLRIFVKGDLPDKGRKKGNIEMYSELRFLTMTGQSFPGTPSTIENRQAELTALHARIFGKPEPEPERRQTSPTSGTLDNATLLRKAMGAANGAKFSRLWVGDTSGYPSQSEADLALAGMLVFWTEGDSARADRLFRQSGLYRPKWDEKHFADGRTYGQATIEEALSGETEFYTPGGKRETATAASEVGRASEETQTAGGKRKAMKDVILELTLGQDITLFTDQHEGAFCRTPRSQHFEILPVNSSTFGDWLGWLLYTQDGRTCSDQTLDPARRVLRAKAKFDGETHKLHNRAAWGSDDALYYDLSDAHWRAIRVTAEGWAIDPTPPILFRRYAHQVAQVEPERVEAGDAADTLADVFKFINLRGKEDRLLFTVYLVSLLIPGIAHPIPVLHGEHGSGKTFALKSVRQLVDPSDISTLAPPWKSDEFVQQLDHHWLAFYDNLASLTDWQQDVICRAVTGEGHTKRKLYSDDEDIIFTYRRCIALNGINVVTTRPDLLDRSILFELDALGDHRKTESELQADFDALRPRLLGAILETLRGALDADADTGRALGRYFRLADWAAWGWRIGEALGGRGDDFIEMYNEAVQGKAMMALELHPLGQAVLVFMSDCEKWDGTAKELLDELTDVAEREGISTEAKLWPGNAAWVGRRLKEIRPDLRIANVTYKVGHDGTKRVYTLRRD